MSSYRPTAIQILRLRVKANAALFVGNVNASALAHDRNVNAAHNILAAGHRRLAEGISVL
jgi:hypothetical protein